MVHEIDHDHAVLEFPQGGERLIRLANVRAMRGAYLTSLTMRTERIRSSGELWEPLTWRAQWVEVIEPASVQIGRAAAELLA